MEECKHENKKENKQQQKKKKGKKRKKRGKKRKKAENVDRKFTKQVGIILYIQMDDVKVRKQIKKDKKYQTGKKEDEIAPQTTTTHKRKITSCRRRTTAIHAILTFHCQGSSLLIF
jgi:hypothetical protein